MRIGFYVGEVQGEELGGGNTFQSSIIDDLINYSTTHEVYFYYKSDKNLFEGKKDINFVNMNFEQTIKYKKKLFFKRKKKTQATFNDLVLRDKIELVYFLSPFLYEKTEAPFVFTLWDLAYKKHSFFPEVSTQNDEYFNRDNFFSKILPLASYVVIGNNEGKNQICKYYNIDQDRIKTIPMPTPNYVYEKQGDDAILEKYSLEKGKYLFYPAQFWAHKNHIRLVKAMKKLKEQGSNLKFVFTGSAFGNQEYIKDKIEEYGLKNEVLFLGFVKKEEIIALYKNAYALTYASFFGPDNIPPLEAMALKCPVISSNTAGMEEQLGDCALFFDPKDENELVEKIKSLENKELRESLIKKGEVLAKNCRVENYIKKIFEIIDELVPIRECWK